MTEGGDIAYRVFHKVGSEVVDLIPSGKVESDLLMEKGQIICEDVGKCELYSTL